MECSKGWANRCSKAKNKKCICACGGENHNKAGSLSDIWDKAETTNVQQFTMRYICAHCKQPLKFVAPKGWVHPQGRAYMMECPDCKWIGEQPADKITFATDICPNCKVQGKLMDNHVAHPQLVKAQ
jgi:hypothetical protein